MAIVVTVFLLPTDMLGLDGAAAQIALAVVALSALPATVAFALFARNRAGNDSAWRNDAPDPETALGVVRSG